MRRMRRNGILMLAVGLVLAFVAVVMVRSWLVQQVQRPGPALENAHVVIARRAINYGDEIRADYLMAVPWPSNIRPEGTFTSIAEVTDGDTKRVALRSIEANEPLLRSKVSGFGQKATLASVIDGSKRAITIRVNDVIGVAGFVLPGDRVDVLLTRKLDTKNEDFQNDVVLQNLRVLGIDQEASDAKEKPAVARAVTLEVTTDEAQKLVLAEQVGSLTLALRNGIGSDEKVDTRSIHVRDLTHGMPAKPNVRSASQLATITVVRGTTSATAEVHPESR